MALSALGYAVARIKDRNADIFVGVGNFANPIADPGPDLLYSLGAVRNVKVRGTKRLTSADSHGRTYQKGVDLEITYEVMQTDYSVEFAEIPALLSTDNVMMKVTDALVTAATGAGATETALNLSTAAHAAAGIEFDNVRPTLDFEVDGGGEDSMFTITITARLSNAQIEDIGNAPISLGG